MERGLLQRINIYDIPTLGQPAASHVIYLSLRSWNIYLHNAIRKWDFAEKLGDLIPWGIYKKDLHQHTDTNHNK